MKTRELRADLLLLLTAAIWGFAFVAQRVGMEHVGPFTFNGVRFALGALSLLPLRHLRRAGGRRPRRARLPRSRSVRSGGILAGAVLFTAASLQQIGIVSTTAGKAGFITGLYVVLVPILGSVGGQRVGRGGWLGALLAVVGLYLLSVRGTLQMAAGDALVLGGALFWALHVLVIGRFSSRTDPVELAFLQFCTCSALSLIVAVALEPWSVAALAAAAVPILYGGVMSVGVAYTLQVVAQRHAQPTAAAILLSLETVFAAIGGWLLLDESLPPRGLVGCGLMLAGVLVSQLLRPTPPVEQYVDTRAT